MALTVAKYSFIPLSSTAPGCLLIVATMTCAHCCLQPEGLREMDTIVEFYKVRGVLIFLFYDSAGAHRAVK